LAQRAKLISAVSTALAALALAWSALALAPMPTYATWYLHVVALETSLVAAGLAALAALLAVAGPSGGRGPRLCFALVALSVGLWPLAGACPAFVATRQRFSLAAYGVGPFCARPPAGARHDRDLRLDPESPLRTDLYRPRGDGPFPIVVVLHGGAWRGGDKGQARHVSWALVEQGYAVADLQYGLGRANPFPQAVRELKCQVGRLRERSGALQLDPRRVAYLGRSAGGQIALVAAYSAGDPRLAPSCDVPDAAPARVAAFYAPTDLAWGYEHPSWPDVVQGPQSLELHLAGPPSRRAEAYALASPVSWVTGARLPPSLLVHGTGDRVVDPEHSRRLHSALSRHGHPAELLLINAAEHGFDFRRGGVGEQLARGALLEFLAPLLNPRPVATLQLRALGASRPRPLA
jgi:acetyl esterase/lipase